MRICKIDGCGGKHDARGYCSKHYKKARRSGEFEVKRCSVNGCDGLHDAQGYCPKHYQQLRVKGVFGHKDCKVNGCLENQISKEYCSKHYKQYSVLGEIINSNENCRNPNSYKIDGTVTIIELTNSRGLRVGETLIDTEDLIKVVRLKLHMSKGAAGAYRNGTLLYLQYLVKGRCKGKIIDHINGDPLDNRKANLRHGSTAENSYNSIPSSRNTSGFKGVHWLKREKRWLAYVTANKKRVDLGRFTKKEDAIKARRAGALKYQGEFAYEARPK